VPNLDRPRPTTADATDTGVKDQRTDDEMAQPEKNMSVVPEEKLLLYARLHNLPFQENSLVPLVTQHVMSTPVAEQSIIRHFCIRARSAAP